MVEYLNVVTLPQVQVLAFEVARVNDGDVEILLPRVFGSELAVNKPSQTAQASWTEADFFGWLEEHEPSHLPALRSFAEEAQTHSLVMNNGTAQHPSLILGRPLGATTLWALSLFTAGPYGRKLRFWLERFHDNGLDGRRAAEILNQIPGRGRARAHPRSSGHRGRPRGTPAAMSQTRNTSVQPFGNSI
jgi:hypothetical protein